MKIDELVNLEKYNVDEYDLHDDLQFFMNNDPDFYKKHYYPTVLKMKLCRDRGDDFNPINLSSLVHEAYELYKKKFPVKNLESKLKNEDLEKVCSKIYETEITNIKLGHYD